jgi:hypothetical protein
MHARILYSLAMALVVFSLFVLWVWTGPFGAAVAAFATHALLRICEGQRDGELALERKAQAVALQRGFDRDGQRG